MLHIAGGIILALIIIGLLPAIGYMIGLILLLVIAFLVLSNFESSFPYILGFGFYFAVLFLARQNVQKKVDLFKSMGFDKYISDIRYNREDLLLRGENFPGDSIFDRTKIIKLKNCSIRLDISDRIFTIKILDIKGKTVITETYSERNHMGGSTSYNKWFISTDRFIAKLTPIAQELKEYCSKKIWEDVALPLKLQKTDRKNIYTDAIKYNDKKFLISANKPLLPTEQIKLNEPIFPKENRKFIVEIDYLNCLVNLKSSGYIVGSINYDVWLDLLENRIIKFVN